MLVSTVAGETTIQSGKKIVLAQTDEGQAPGQDDKAQPETAPNGGVAGVSMIIVPIAVAAVVIGISAIAAADNDGSGSGASTSPAAP